MVDCGLVISSSSVLDEQDRNSVTLTSMLNPSGPVPPRFSFIIRDAEAMLQKNAINSNRLLTESATTYKCMSEMYPKMH